PAADDPKPVRGRLLQDQRLNHALRANVLDQIARRFDSVYRLDDRPERHRRLITVFDLLLFQQLEKTFLFFHCLLLDEADRQSGLAGPLNLLLVRPIIRVFDHFNLSDWKDRENGVLVFGRDFYGLAVTWILRAAFE